jgi:branched-chain amino acid transport system ATP-binding protein
MLEIENLHAGYGHVIVLREVSIRVSQDQIVGLLGANGAGKTTLIRAISGLASVHAGEIRFLGERVSNMSAQGLVRRGLIQIPQGRLLFGEMSVRENLELGAYLIRTSEDLDKQFEFVHTLFPILRERTDQSAGLLSGGEQQMLALARALMGKPRCLLLDEPSLGLAPKVFNTILDAVRRIHQRGIPVLIAEQNVRKILKLVDYCYVLENGRVVLEGEPQSLSGEVEVRASYLGATSS